MTLSEAIGPVVKAEREKRNLGQRGMAMAMGLSSAKQRTYISKVENGKAIPTIESLESIARAFKISLSSLFVLVEEYADDPDNYDQVVPAKIGRLQAAKPTLPASVHDPAAIKRRKKLAVELGVLPEVVL